MAPWLKKKGKTSLIPVVACMRKLLTIIYYCVVKGERFDPCRHLLVSEKWLKKDGNSTPSDSSDDALSCRTPITNKKLRKRLQRLLEKKADTNPRGNT